jgi:hypothetical protein
MIRIGIKWQQAMLDFFLMHCIKTTPKSWLKKYHNTRTHWLKATSYIFPVFRIRIWIGSRLDPDSFSCSLEILYRSLGKSKLQFLIKKK